MTILLSATAFAVLAAAGALGRAALARLDAELPVGTLAANTAASFVAGLAAGSAYPTILLVGIGLCGSLSTFSTLVRHLHDQAAGRHSRRLLLTVGLSLGLGLAAAVAGLEIAGA